MHCRFSLYEFLFNDTDHYETIPKMWHLILITLFGDFAFIGQLREAESVVDFRGRTRKILFKRFIVL